MKSTTLRRRLQSELRRVREQLGLRDGASDGAVGDEQDVAAASVERDLAQADRERLTVRAVRLHRAIERVDRDEYGICVTCAGPIPEARLKAIPEAERCVPCEQRAERTRQEPACGIPRTARPTRPLEELGAE